MAVTKEFPWFRVYTAIVDDDKMSLLAFEDRWHYVALLALKRAGVLDSGAPHRDRRLALKLQLSQSAFDEVRRRLVEVGLIDENLQPLAWAKRQVDSDTTGAQRVHKSRISGMKRYCNVTGTPSTGDVKRYSNVSTGAANSSADTYPESFPDSESESESESDSEKSESQREDARRETEPATEQHGSRRASRATRRMPIAYEPGTQLLAWAATEAPLVNFAHALATIRDHEFKTAHRDWHAVVRNWLRRDQQQREQFNAKNGITPPRVFSDDDHSMDGMEGFLL